MLDGLVSTHWFLSRVTRRMGKKFAQILAKVAQTVAKAKNDL
jgi:hypothetical protein